MEVELSDRARKVIEQRVADGDFANAAEAIEEAVRLLEEEHAAYIASVNAMVAEAYASSARGESLEGSPALFESVRERIRQRAAARQAEHR